MENTSWFELAVGVLAVWRLTHLLHAEAGPWQILARGREALGRGALGELFGCFYCLSLSVAAPIVCLSVPLAPFDVKRAALRWLALSAGAIFLERWLHGEPAPLAYYREDPQENDDVLRT